MSRLRVWVSHSYGVGEAFGRGVKDVTVCFTYFKNLGLKNLNAALYSVHQQDLSNVEALVIVDNNSSDSVVDVKRVAKAQGFPVQVCMVSRRHGDPTKTHAWSTNMAVREVVTPWIFFTRADYLLDFSIVKKFVDVAHNKPNDWNGFITANGCHLGDDIEACGQTAWRSVGPHIFRGQEFDHTAIDAGVWMARRDAFWQVGGLDERLSAWGHAQTHFQWKLYKSGVEFVRIPEVLFYHPFHGGQRDIEAAHVQLRENGIDLKELWARYEGVQPY